MISNSSLNLQDLSRYFMNDFSKDFQGWSWLETTSFLLKQPSCTILMYHMCGQKPGKALNTVWIHIYPIHTFFKFCRSWIHFKHKNLSSTILTKWFFIDRRVIKYYIKVFHDGVQRSCKKIVDGDDQNCQNRHQDLVAITITFLLQHSSRTSMWLN